MALLEVYLKDSYTPIVIEVGSSHGYIELGSDFGQPIASVVLVGVTKEGTPIRLPGSRIPSLIADEGERHVRILLQTPTLVQSESSEWANSRAYRFQLRIEQDASLHLDIDRDRNTWLSEDNRAASGLLDAFCVKNTRRGKSRETILKTHIFPYKALGFVRRFKARAYSGSGDHLSIGLFRRGDSGLFIVMGHIRKLATNQATATLDSFDRVSPVELKYKARKRKRVVLLLNAIKLDDEGGDWRYAWHADSRDALKTFARAYNECIDTARDGLWKSRNDEPWVVNPNIALTNTSALFMYGVASGHYKICRLVPVSARGDTNEDMQLTYQWKARSLRDIDSISYDSAVTCHALRLVPRQNTGNIIAPNGGVMDALLESASTWEASVNGPELNLSIETSLKQILLQNDHPHSLRSFGSIRIGFGARPSADGFHERDGKVTLRLRSGYGPGSSGLFASSRTEGMQVGVQLGSTSDANSSFSEFDLSNADEGLLHDDTDAVIHLNDEVDTSILVATLSIRTENRFGSQETVQLEITRKKEVSLDVDRFSLFNAKPFLYAAISSINRDPEGGEVIARWRNDDGREWRMPYLDATVILPAQSVGEEMERGQRFWPGINDSYIEDTSPIKFRFAPSTELVLEPDAGQRRFNTVPSNIFALLNGAGVRSFRTEMVYPVAIQYERSDKSTVDVRLSESASFFGRPGANIPYLRGRVFSSTVFEGALSDWASKPGNWDVIVPDYMRLRINHSAVKSNYAARISELVLWDANRPNDSFLLQEDLAFELRSHKDKKDWDDAEEVVPFKHGGALTPPMMNPLPVNPRVGDITNIDLRRIHAFLTGMEWDEDRRKGGIRGGVLHSIEFPSELLAILRNPSTTEGWLSDVVFSNLGVSGRMEVAFDEGRTTFTAEIQHGQLSRLIRTRIGRIGITWSRAKHIIIYDRTVVPSQQFMLEQEADAHPGWPIMRKTEEYVEPIDVRRVFSKESRADRSKTGFIDEFEMITRRIYVNSAWGEELDGPVSGYKIPLWDGGLSEKGRTERASKSASTTEASIETGDPPDEAIEDGWYYPKPKLALISRDDDGSANRQWIDDPDELVFYTNTVEGAGGDPDRWPGVPGVDAPNGLFRNGVIIQKPLGQPWMDFAENAASSSPRRDALRRKGFEFRVTPDASINLQARRGDEPMFTRIGLVSLGRSAEQAAASISEFPETIKEAAKTLQVRAQASGVVADFTAPIEAWLKNIDDRFTQFACQESAEQPLIREIRRLEKEAKAQVQRSFNSLPEPLTAPDHSILVAELRQEITGLSLVSPRIIEEFAADARSYLSDLVVEVNADTTLGHLRGVAKDIRSKIESIRKRIESARVSIKRDIVKATKVLTDIPIGGSSLLQQLGVALTNAAIDIRALGDSADDDIASMMVKIGNTRVELASVGAKLANANRAPFRNAVRQLILLVGGLDNLLERTMVLLEYNPPNSEPYNPLPIRENALKGVKNASEFLTDLASAISSVQAGLDRLATEIEDRVDKAADNIWAAIQDIDRQLELLDAAVVDGIPIEQAAQQIRALKATLLLHIDVGVAAGQQSALATLEQSNAEIQTAINTGVGQLANGIAVAFTHATGVYTKAIAVYTSAIEGAESWFEKKISDTASRAIEVIKSVFADVGDDLCDKLKDAKEKVREQFRDAEKGLKEQVASKFQDIFDEQTRRDFAELERRTAEQIEDLRREHGDTIGRIDAGLKVAKAIGDMPKLPNLTFNVDRAEYVFDDLKEQIATSPFATRLKEIDSGLREMGINIPCEAIDRQFGPVAGNVEAQFGKVVNAVALELEPFLKKVRLPQIRREDFQLTHGVDANTRSAWAKAKVSVDVPGRNALFETGSFGIFMADIEIRGETDIRVGSDGKRESRTDGRLKSDWALRMAGTDMATFREVTVQYDGDQLDFDIDPKKVDYHPSLRFISDVAKQLEGTLPPDVKLLKDERGRPYGAEAKMETLIEEPPVLGPVTLGPLALDSGVRLTLANKGDFEIKSFAGVGSEERPVFVQIGWLGGGAWVACEIRNVPKENGDGRQTITDGSVGVALGSVRAINLGNVARGSYSFLLFADARFSSLNGSVLRAGLSVRGSARLLSIATIYVYLLLVAIHSSKGGTTGKGQLRAKVKISRFYTLRIKKSVKKDI